MNRPYREVKKPFAIRIVELVRALQLMADAARRIREGKTHYLVTLSGQLRALLTERSTKTAPLLLCVAEQLGKDLPVYCMPNPTSRPLPPDLMEGLLLHVSGFPITLQKQLANQVQMTLHELLDYKIVLFKGKEYSPREIIDWYANKAGGAHYADRLPEDFSSLLLLGGAGFQPLVQVLLQLGEATIASGRRLLKSLVDFELHTLIALPWPLPKPLTDVTYLFDYQYPGSDMRITFSLNDNLTPSFFVRGLQGVWARVDSDRMIDWSESRYLHASLTIEDDLSTSLELRTDGTRVGRIRVDEPLFVLSEPRDYEIYHNRSVDGAPQNFTFGVSEVVMVGTELNGADRANLLLYLLDKRTDPDLPFVLYSPGSFAHAPQGITDLQMTGNVRQVRAGDIVKPPTGHAPA